MQCLVESFIRRYVSSSKGPLVPSEITQNLRVVSKLFRPGRQEDAHEFLRRLLESCSPHKIPGPLGVFDQIFSGKLRSRIQCAQCHNTSDTFDLFMDICLEVAGCNTLTDCLSKFTAIEVLEGANSYKCKSCDKKVRATKQLQLYSFPSVLTIQLKRFDIFRSSAGKLHRKISFPSSFDFSDFVCQETKDCVYNLSGFVVHVGSSMSSGHYYAYCRSQARTWVCFDDERTFCVGSEKAFQESAGAYLLFYERSKSISQIGLDMTEKLVDVVPKQPTKDEVLNVIEISKQPRLSYSVHRQSCKQLIRLMNLRLSIKKSRKKGPRRTQDLRFTSKKVFKYIVPRTGGSTEAIASWEGSVYQGSNDCLLIPSMKRSLEDIEVDRSSRLVHKSAYSKTTRPFDGKNLFDHAGFKTRVFKKSGTVSQKNKRFK